MTGINFQPYNKKLLRDILGMSKSTLNRYMAEIENDIFERFPRYKKRGSKLPNNVFLFICDDYGLSRPEIAERLKNYFPNYNQVDIEKIRGIYGL